MNQIPSVDLEDFLGKDNDKRLSFIKNLGRAYEEIGFVALKGHFLDKDLVDELYTQVRLFLVFLMKLKPNMKFQGLLVNVVTPLLEKSMQKEELLVI